MLLNIMKDKSKLKDKIEEKFERKEYINKENIYEARSIFKIRNHMMEVKTNFWNDPQYSRELWQCSGCYGAIDTMSHILYCPSYVNLREGKSLENAEDVLKYYIQVSKIRSKAKHSKNML